MSTIVRNFAALAGSQVASWIVGMLVFIMLPRYLGELRFGEYSFASSFVALFGLMAGLGTAPFITKETARNQSLLSLYVGTALALQAPLVIGLSAVAIETVRLVGKSPETVVLVAAACLGMGPGVFSTTLVAAMLLSRESWLILQIGLGIAAYGGASIGLRTLALGEIYRIGVRYLVPHQLRKAIGTR